MLIFFQNEDTKASLSDSCEKLNKLRVWPVLMNLSNRMKGCKLISCFFVQIFSLLLWISCVHPINQHTNELSTSSFFNAKSTVKYRNNFAHIVWKFLTLYSPHWTTKVRHLQHFLYCAEIDESTRVNWLISPQAIKFLRKRLNYYLNLKIMDCRATNLQRPSYMA